MLLSAPGRFASSPCIVQPFLLYSFVLSSFFLFISILFIFVHLNLSVLGCVRCLMGTTLLFNPSLRDDVHVGWCNYCVLATTCINLYLWWRLVCLFTDSYVATLVDARTGDVFFFILFYTLSHHVYISVFLGKK